MRAEHTATPRRVVGGWVLLGLLLVTGLVGMAEWLRYDHPPSGPPTPEVAAAPDGLREEIPCELPPAREGEPPPEAMAEPSLPEPITSNALYDCPTTWDGRRVRYSGEAIGAVLRRGDRAWVQLNDDVYAGTRGPLPTHRDYRGGNAGIGALITAEMADIISTVGDARHRGDVVEVVAVFHRVHEPTGEVAILEVESLELVDRGGVVTQPSSTTRPIVASIAAALALATVAVERWLRRR